MCCLLWCIYEMHPTLSLKSGCDTTRSFPPASPPQLHALPQPISSRGPPGPPGTHAPPQPSSRAQQLARAPCPAASRALHPSPRSLASQRSSCLAHIPSSGPASGACKSPSASSLPRKENHPPAHITLNEEPTTTIRPRHSSNLAPLSSLSNVASSLPRSTARLEQFATLQCLHAGAAAPSATSPSSTRSPSILALDVRDTVHPGRVRRARAVLRRHRTCATCPRGKHLPPSRILSLLRLPLPMPLCMTTSTHARPCAWRR
jgi:hypothetical protein